MATCFDFSIRRCEEVANNIDDLFASINSEELFSMFEDAESSVLKLSRDAFQITKSNLIDKAGYLHQKLNQRTGRFADSNGINSGYYELESGTGAYSKIKLKKAYINLDYTGSIQLKFTNELGEITTLSKSIVSNVTATLDIDTIFEYVKVEFVDQTKQGKYVSCSSVNGLILDYDLICDIDSYLCDNKELYLPLVKLKLGSLIITEGVFSGELNKRVFQPDSYEKLRLEYETQFGLLLREKNIKDLGCVECRNQIKSVVNLP